MNDALYQLKFLESIENLKAILSEKSGKTISYRLCNNIMCCLQQGRTFFEIAESSPLEVKPLITFYGMMGFARAIIIARSLKSIETLPQKHGLADVSSDATKIESLTLKVMPSGTFHLMNDSVNKLEKFIIHKGPEKIYFRQPTVKSQELIGKTITLKDILARIDGIEKHYLETFDENSKVVGCSHFSEEIIHSTKCLTLQVYWDNIFKSAQELLEIVVNLRNVFSFLSCWSFDCASHAGGFTSITFTNQIYQGREPEDNLDILPKTFATSPFGYHALYQGVPALREDILNITTPILGGLSSSKDTYLAEPYDGLFLSELTLHYMGMFLLSSLVRYRPEVWSNALSRRAFSNNPVDDKALSLVEHFIEICLSEFPRLVVCIIKEPFT